MKVTLVVMAAGIGSRFGGGIKQLFPVGPNGEIIINYSIFDALEAGFNDIVFIIRRDLEADFKEIIGNKVAEVCPVSYVYQELDSLPAGYEKPCDRVKPWGTGHAILLCKDIINNPFAVINADDYYGKESFKLLYDNLVSESAKSNFFLVSYILKNTLSDNGSVTRGICKVDVNNNLTEIVETKSIEKYGDNAKVGNNIIDGNTLVSMNMWGFNTGVFAELESGFQQFLSENIDDLKSEYLLPDVIKDMLAENKVVVKSIETADKWVGMTYEADKVVAKEAFEKYVKQGLYKSPLNYS